MMSSNIYAHHYKAVKELAMQIVGLDHVQLAMPAGQEAQARAFYAELLGLTEVAKPAPLAARGGCWFAGPGTMLHLGIEAEFQPARKAHPVLRARSRSEPA
jgi:catechol 2,3-dioxygenase-like lactoylglutathione lyase family enzyme